LMLAPRLGGIQDTNLPEYRLFPWCEIHCASPFAS
jgi:hypothetical protein